MVTRVVTKYYTILEGGPLYGRPQTSQLSNNIFVNCQTAARKCLASEEPNPNIQVVSPSSIFQEAGSISDILRSEKDTSSASVVAYYQSTIVHRSRHSINLY